MILAIIFAWMGYQRAKSSGRNGLFWAFIALATFIGTQLIIGLLIRVVIGLGIEAFGWPEGLFETYEIPINLIAIACSLITGFLVLKYLNDAPVAVNYAEPPPPPKFE